VRGAAGIFGASTATRIEVAANVDNPSLAFQVYVLDAPRFLKECVEVVSRDQELICLLIGEAA
jgi:hypothetical protein